MNITLSDLLEAGVHFGHQTRHWNPKMADYIFGVHEKTHIINLEKTLPLLQNAMNFLSKIASKKGKVLFVGTKFSARTFIQEKAEACKMPYINYRWPGGMLTNYKTVRHSIKRLKALEAQFEKEAFFDLTKKEILILSRKKEKLSRMLGGVKNMNGLPDALFVVDVRREKTAILEAKKLLIPIIGIVDTNSDPDGIDYVIPGNDDSVRAIQLYLNLAVDHILKEKSYLMETDEEAGEDEFVEVETSEAEKLSSEEIVDEPTAKEIFDDESADDLDE
jgi:small subunit ribosomal protein S2